MPSISLHGNVAGVISTGVAPLFCTRLRTAWKWRVTKPAEYLLCGSAWKADAVASNIPGYEWLTMQLGLRRARSRLCRGPPFRVTPTKAHVPDRPVLAWTFGRKPGFSLVALHPGHRPGRGSGLSAVAPARSRGADPSCLAPGPAQPARARDGTPSPPARTPVTAC